MDQEAVLACRLRFIQKTGCKVSGNPLTLLTNFPQKSPLNEPAAGPTLPIAGENASTCFPCKYAMATDSGPGGANRTDSLR